MLAEAQIDDSHCTEARSEDQTILLTPDRHAKPVATLPGRDEELLVGQRIGQYAIEELLGRGSFGTVYRAVDSRLGRDVAIKVAARRISEDPHLRELYWNEARVQARLEHSNIVPVYDLLEESGRMAMVMRLIHGTDLDKRLRQMVRPFTPAETVQLMCQVASAVGSAHEKGVVHQDLKPGNIRLTADAEAVVLDFGAARIAGEVAPDQPGTTGTPAYMAPEQIRGEVIDARADIYALAMTLYKTLTGHHPFEEARNLAELLAWQVERTPLPPTHYNPHLPEAVSEVILRGLSKEPRERFRACVDFTRALSVALGMEEAAPAADGDGRWHPRARMSLAAEVRPAGGDSVAARVIDLSVTGASLRVPRPIAIGLAAGLVLRIPLKSSEHLVRCSMRVLKIIPDPESGQFRAGVRFDGLGTFDRAVLGDLVRAVLVHKASG